MANETIGQKHSGWQHRELSFVIGCFGLDLRCFEFTSGTGHWKVGSERPLTQNAGFPSLVREEAARLSVAPAKDNWKVKRFSLERRGCYSGTCAKGFSRWWRAVGRHQNFWRVCQNSTWRQMESVKLLVQTDHKFLMWASIFWRVRHQRENTLTLPSVQAHPRTRGEKAWIPPSLATKSQYSKLVAVEEVPGNFPQNLSQVYKSPSSSTMLSASIFMLDGPWAAGWVFFFSCDTSDHDPFQYLLA